MNKETILQSDLLDIIFENRNKAYGAYELRKFYTKRLSKALGGMIAFSLFCFSFTLLPKQKQAEKPEMLDTIMSQILPEKKLEKKPEVEVKQQQKTAGTKKGPTNNIVIVDNNTHTDTIQNFLPTDVAGPVTVDPLPGDGGALVEPVPEPVAPGPAPKDPVDVITPRASADVMPEYPGGMAALRKFLERHLTNPRDLEEGETVSVQIKFVVGYDGKLKSFATQKDGGTEFNNEVVRVLKKMPAWIPGKASGENVSVYYVMPVKFVPAE